MATMVAAGACSWTHFLEAGRPGDLFALVELSTHSRFSSTLTLR
jgi:hypothetical protein